MTYTIHRYPAELIDVVRIAGFHPVTIRPILPQDAEIMQVFVQTLSDASRRNRFFRTLRELPADQLHRLTSVDYHQHLALVAEVFIGGVEMIVGETRYVIDDDGRGAEFALAVADDWQGRGIGRLLLERLERGAAADGVRRLHGETLSVNRGMQRFARKAGFTVTHDPRSPGVFQLAKTITPTSTLPLASQPDLVA